MISFAEIKKWKFLPFEKLILSSSLGVDEILQLLDSKIIWSTNIYKSIKHPFKNYIGFIAENKFKIRRIPMIGYNGFLPIAEGKVKNKIGRTEISVIIKFDNLQIILFTFGVISFLFDYMFKVLDTSTIIISLIVYIILIAFFNDEAKFIKDDLKDFFKAELIENKNAQNIHQHKIKRY